MTKLMIDRCSLSPSCRLRSANTDGRASSLVASVCYFDSWRWSSRTWLPWGSSGNTWRFRSCTSELLSARKIARSCAAAGSSSESWDRWDTWEQWPRWPRSRTKCIERIAPAARRNLLCSDWSRLSVFCQINQKILVVSQYPPEQTSSAIRSRTASLGWPFWIAASSLDLSSRKVRAGTSMARFWISVHWTIQYDLRQVRSNTLDRPSVVSALISQCLLFQGILCRLETPRLSGGWGCCLALSECFLLILFDLFSWRCPECSWCTSQGACSLETRTCTASNTSNQPMQRLLVWMSSNAETSGWAESTGCAISFQKKKSPSWVCLLPEYLATRKVTGRTDASRSDGAT